MRQPAAGPVIGSETQSYEAQIRCTGIQRVVRATHTGLVDHLGVNGIALRPIHTRSLPRSAGFARDPYLAGDPVLQWEPRPITEIAALLLLDLNPYIHFQAIREERAVRRLPVVALIYDILPIIHPEWFPESARRHFRVFLQQVLSVADHIVVTSDKVRRDLQGLGWDVAAQIHVIPLGSHFGQEPAASFSDDRLALLYVSTLAPRKGHQLLLDAFDQLDARDLDVSLTLIGAPGWDMPVIDMVRGHRAFGGRIRWLPHASDAEIRAAARRSTLAVMPPEDEGFGLFLEEALTLGLPVVATDIAVLRERAQANVHFSEGTATGLAAAITTAHRQAWVSPEVPIRSMLDFSNDIGSLLVDLLR